MNLPTQQHGMRILLLNYSWNSAFFGGINSTLSAVIRFKKAVRIWYKLNKSLLCVIQIEDTKKLWIEAVMSHLEVWNLEGQG